MANIIVNSTAMEFLRELVADNEVNLNDGWSFSAEDGNSLLGEDGDDWEEFARYHLAIDTDASRETKERFKFPVGKGGQIYRRGVIAAKQRAAQAGYSNIENEADKLLQMIDKNDKNITIYEQVMNFLFPNRKEVDLTLPKFMIENLKRGLRLHEEGKSGDGLVPATVREAKRMIETGRITPDKIVRASAWLARHASDKTEGWNKQGNETPGFVAHLLWLSNGEDNAKEWLDRKKEELNRKDIQILDLPQVPDPNGNFIVVKEIDGTGRWFGWTTNKFEDREEEILTDASHVEFCKFLDAHPHEAPELWIWHTKGTAKSNRADWWDYANGFFMYSGVLTEDEMVAYENVKGNDEPIGMSHGFYVLERNGKYINKYRTFEVSELPLNMAANPFTLFQIKEEATKMFSVTKRAFLVDRLGEDRVSQLEKGTEEMEKALEEMGVNYKELNAEYEAEQEKAIAERVAVATKEAVANVVEQVVKALNVEQLQATIIDLYKAVEANQELANTVNELSEKVTHILQTEDEKIAKAIAPVEPFTWGKSATTSEENIVDEKELDAEIVKQIVDATPEFDWLSGLNPFGGK